MGSGSSRPSPPAGKDKAYVAICSTNQDAATTSRIVEALEARNVSICLLLNAGLHHGVVAKLTPRPCRAP